MIVVRAFFALFCVAVAAATECPECDRQECPIISFCPAGVTQDVCGCCQVCSQGLGHKCDENEVEPKHGKCGEFSECSKDGVCVCSEPDPVCGSDDVTYESLCAFLAATEHDEKLTVIDRAPCRTGPLIKSPPKDASRPQGSILVLDCEATGFPVPSITWELYKPDGSTTPLPSDDSLVAVQVRGGPEKHMVTGWVQIMKVLPENVGIYTCIATNPKGEVKASAKVSFGKSNPSKKNRN